MEARNALFENKKDIVEAIRRIILSALLLQTQGIHTFCQRKNKTLKETLAATNCYVLALDESCDITQLIIFVRYLDSPWTIFWRTTGYFCLCQVQLQERICPRLLEYFNQAELEMKTVTSVTTDGHLQCLGVGKAWFSDSAMIQNAMKFFILPLHHSSNVAVWTSVFRIKCKRWCK